MHQLIQLYVTVVTRVMANKATSIC